MMARVMRAQICYGFADSRLVPFEDGQGVRT